MAWWWSWVLTAVGVFGLWLAGRHDRRGWWVGISAQGLWISYAIATRQWGFIVSALAYGTVYARNTYLWRREQRPVKRRREARIPPGFKGIDVVVDTPVIPTDGTLPPDYKD